MSCESESENEHNLFVTLLEFWNFTCDLFLRGWNLWNWYSSQHFSAWQKELKNWRQLKKGLKVEIFCKQQWREWNEAGGWTEKITGIGLICSFDEWERENEILLQHYFGHICHSDIHIQYSLEIN